jgi:hypothetical protein
MAKKTTKKTLKTLLSSHKLMLFVICSVVIVTGMLLYQDWKASHPNYISKYENIIQDELAILANSNKIASKNVYKKCTYYSKGILTTGIDCYVESEIIFAIKDSDYVALAKQSTERLLKFTEEMKCETYSSKISSLSSVDLLVKCYKEVSKPYFPLTNSKDKL